MENLEPFAQSAIALDEDTLTVQLGALSDYVNTNPEAESDITSMDAIPTPRGGFDDLLQAGLNVFNSVSPAAYNIFCSPVEGVLIKDPDLAKELSKLMDEKTAEAATKVTMILTPALTGSLGLPQSLAVLVGALLVKKLAKGTSDIVCTNWLKTIEDPLDRTQDINPL